MRLIQNLMCAFVHLFLKFLFSQASTITAAIMITMKQASLCKDFFNGCCTSYLDFGETAHAPQCFSAL